MEQPKPEGINDPLLAKLVEHTLKIARSDDPNFSDDKIIDGIVNNLKRMKDAPDFPAVIDMIDPDQHYPETKQLSEKAKDRIRKAIEIFSNEV